MRAIVGACVVAISMAMIAGCGRGKEGSGAVAEEFGVNLRTAQRDLNERFAYLPLVKTDGRYLLDPVFLGRLSTRDIERFASLAGVRGLARAGLAV